MKQERMKRNLYHRLSVVLSVSLLLGTNCSSRAHAKVSTSSPEFRRAFELAQQGKKAEALSAFSAVLDQDPEFIEARDIRGHLYQQGQKWAEAAADFAFLAKRETRKIDWPVNEGDCHARLGNYKKALECYQRALAIDASNVHLLRATADSYVKLGRPGESIRYWDASLAQSSDPVLLMERAQAYQHLGKRHEEINDILAASANLCAQLKKQDAAAQCASLVALKRCNTVLQEAGAWKESADLLNTIVNIPTHQPRDPVLLMERARAFRQLGKTTEETRDIVEASAILRLELKNRDASARSASMAALQQCNAILQQVSAWKESIEVTEFIVQHHADEQTLRQLANARVQSGDFTGGLRACTQCIKINPKDSISYYARALCEFKLGHLPESLHDCQTARQLGFSKAATASLFIDIYQATHKTDKALAELKILTNLPPLSAEKYIHAAELSAKLRQFDEADQYLKRARELDAPHDRLQVVELACIKQRFEHDEQKQFDALNDYIKRYGTEKNKGGSEVYRMRAIIWSQRKEPKKAFEDWSMAIELGCRDPRAYLERSRMYEDRWQPEKALADVNMALTVSPDLAEAYKQRAHVYGVSLDEPDLAKRDMQTYAKLIEHKP